MMLLTTGVSAYATAKPKPKVHTGGIVRGPVPMLLASPTLYKPPIKIHTFEYVCEIEKPYDLVWSTDDA